MSEIIKCKKCKKVIRENESEGMKKLILAICEDCRKKEKGKKKKEDDPELGIDIEISEDNEGDK